MRGSLTKTADFKYMGDTVYYFKPINNVIGPNSPRLMIPFSTLNRRGRRALSGIISIVVEASSPNIDWKVKVNGINLTREFRPNYSLLFGGKSYYKFLFDIESILNTKESIEKNWVNLLLKHEGGSPLELKYVLLITGFEDQDFKSDCEYWSGLVLLEPGDKLSLITDRKTGSTLVVSQALDANTRMLLATSGGNQSIIYNSVGAFEEHLVPNIPSELSIPGTRLRGILLSELLYLNVYSKPINIAVKDVSVSRVGEEILLRFTVVNRGDARPDNLVYTLISRGNILYTYRDNAPLNVQEERPVEVKIVAKGRLEEPVLRVVWSKSSITSFMEVKLPSLNHL